MCDCEEFSRPSRMIANPKRKVRMSPPFLHSLVSTSAGRSYHFVPSKATAFEIQVKFPAPEPFEDDTPTMSIAGDNIPPHILKRAIDCVLENEQAFVGAFYNSLPQENNRRVLNEEEFLKL